MNIKQSRRACAKTETGHRRRAEKVERSSKPKEERCGWMTLPRKSQFLTCDMCLMSSQWLVPRPGLLQARVPVCYVCAMREVDSCMELHASCD